MASLHGLIRKNYGKLYGERLVLDAERKATPTHGPLGLFPTAEPTNAAEGALYFDSTAHALMQYNGSAWEQVGASPSGNVAIGGDLAVTGGATVGTTLAVTGASTLTGNISGAAGAGFTGTGTVMKSSAIREGGIIKTTYLMDITGLHSSTTNLDIIGGTGLASSHFGRFTTAVNGTYLGGFMTCTEAPLTGDPDIDLWGATESTGTEDAAGGSTLTESILVTSAASWTLGRVLPLLIDVPADSYFYLIVGNTGVPGTYTAGRFLIQLYGSAA